MQCVVVNRCFLIENIFICTSMFSLWTDLQLILFFAQLSSKMMFDKLHIHLSVDPREITIIMIQNKSYNSRTL
jgi:hypothetical protein